MSKVSKATIILVIFFGLDKVIALLRQILFARTFQLSAALDAFNVANNIPDMLFALISGGSLAMALIPVLSGKIATEGRASAWNLFSRIANLAFIVTAALAVIVAILADTIVKSEFGVAPGFGPDQQQLVINLMRLNLVATIIFSISGLVMASLQANQHFLLPAMAPLFYNLGQIFGVTILSPENGYVLGGITLPAYSMGIYGLVAGVIIGAVLHLAIQIPGLIKYKFKWTPVVDIRSPEVVHVLKILGPRLVTMFFIQLIFIARDNLASRLAEGAVSSLTYGWNIMQVPETLIGTVIGTALLPTISEFAAQGDWESFRSAFNRASRALVALTLPIAVILAIGLRPLIKLAFDFDAAGTDLLLMVSWGYLAGLTGQCLLEIAVRSFYARQNAITPLITAAINAIVFIALGSLLFQALGAPGISLADAIAFTSQAVILLVLINRMKETKLEFRNTIGRAILAALAAGAAGLAIQWIGAQIGISNIIITALVFSISLFIVLPFIWQEVKSLVRL
ncbi:MAG: murein biosynthesis integral membrane protein MurJ [Anaerolineaceae bacterium]